MAKYSADTLGPGKMFFSGEEGLCSTNQSFRKS